MTVCGDGTREGEEEGRRKKKKKESKTEKIR